MRYLPLLLLIISTTLFADRVLVKELADVQVFGTELQSDEGHRIGDTYSAVNRNDYPVYVKVTLTRAENAYNGLIRGEIYVGPGEEIPVGSITQLDTSIPADWEFHITVEPAYAEADGY